MLSLHLFTQHLVLSSITVEALLIPLVISSLFAFICVLARTLLLERM